jgi:catechol 2,3-dioxygenase-like lactoylglutathione lyase family enzyme
LIEREHVPSYDVVVVGAGAAGLSAGALLVKEGKQVVVLDRGPYLGGRPAAGGRPNGRFQFRATTRGGRMRFGKVSHIAIGVSDMAESRHFYRDVLGMRVTLDDPYENPDGKLPDTVGDERGQSRHAVYLRWEEEDAPDSSFIVLTQYGDARGSGVALDDIGISHVSFWVDDVDAVYRRVVAHGVDVMVKPHIGDTVSYGEAPGGKIKTILFRDPDGTILQVDERLPA